MTQPQSDNVVLVFAKPPVPGLVKTRLIPSIGADGATRVYTQLLERTVRLAAGSKQYDLQIQAAYDSEHTFFNMLSTEYDITVTLQQEGNLGERLQGAIASALKHYKRVVVIGADCPFIDEAYITEALQALQIHDVVLGPALDGGYVLVAVKALSKKLFSGIPWSTSTVLEETISRCKEAGLSYKQLQPLRDIDEYEDLIQAAAKINFDVAFKI